MLRIDSDNNLKVYFGGVVGDLKFLLIRILWIVFKKLW